VLAPFIGWARLKDLPVVPDQTAGYAATAMLLISEAIRLRCDRLQGHQRKRR
jgi:hypothetical protein